MVRAFIKNGYIEKGKKVLMVLDAKNGFSWFESSMCQKGKLIRPSRGVMCHELMRSHGQIGSLKSKVWLN